ncbi:GIY-YIG nuclease family protein [Echinicola sediminis]
MEQLFTVYVLFSPSSGKTYTGMTTDLINRFHSHNTFAKKGFTIRYRPWMVIHVEFFYAQASALKREKELKTGKGGECPFPVLLCA